MTLDLFFNILRKVYIHNCLQTQITFSPEYCLQEFLNYKGHDLSVRPSKVLTVGSTRCCCIIIGPWMTKEDACEFAKIVSGKWDHTELNLRAYTSVVLCQNTQFKWWV